MKPRPFDYIRTGRPSDVVVVVTYSGSTTDCGDAIDFAREIGVPRIALLTAAARPLLSELRSSWKRAHVDLYFLHVSRKCR